MAINKPKKRDNAISVYNYQPGLDLYSMITDKITVVVITHLSKVMRRGYSILTIYEHALKPYIKLPSHMPKYQTHRKEETFSKQVKRTVSKYWQYCVIVLNAYFEQVSVKSKIAKQFIYNWLQQAKILSKFYRNERKAAERDATMISLPLTLGRFLAYELPDQKM